MNTSETTDKIGVVILAAGKGKRMQSDRLKVMHEINGTPLVDFVVKAVERAGFSLKPVVIVCPDNPAVQNYLGDRADYVVQTEQLGTGHAVSMAESLFKDRAEQVIVLYGDMPFITTESIKKLAERQLERDNTLTMMTAIVPDFEDWRKNLMDYGRIIRGENGHIVKIVEKKDATPEELTAKEVNPSFFCFKADWLWENLKNLKNNNAQGEYYLTDLVKVAFDKKVKMSSIEIDSKEALGINTKEHLEIAQNIK